MRFKIHSALSASLRDKSGSIAKVKPNEIVEIQSVEKNHPVQAKQLRTHLVLAGLPLGLVLNFGLETIKEGITRMVNGLPE